jgi:organic hydroperoxide reductase OsmC/OhrA
MPPSSAETARIAEAAKQGCPASTALEGNVKLELDARLE